MHRLLLAAGIPVPVNRSYVGFVVRKIRAEWDAAGPRTERSVSAPVARGELTGSICDLCRSDRHAVPVLEARRLRVRGAGQVRAGALYRLRS